MHMCLNRLRIERSVVPGEEVERRNREARASPEDGRLIRETEIVGNEQEKSTYIYIKKKTER